MAIEKVLNRKMRARYLGLLIVISRNKGGAYIVTKLDGSIFDCPVTAFRVILYFARMKLDLPVLDKLLDVSHQQLQQMKDSEDADPENDEAEDLLDND